jgi:hypothetical protein
MKIYRLESENLSGLGGPMGSERTSINYVMYTIYEEEID